MRETQPGVDVLAHPNRIHLEPGEESVHATGHVEGEHRRVGKDDPLRRRMGNVTFVPQGDVLQRGRHVSAQHT